VLAGLYLRAGDLDQAQATAETALRFAQRHGERGNEAWAYWALGEALSERGEFDAAQHHLESARALADELGLRPLSAHCRFGLGRLYRRTGKQQPAQESLTAAITTYRVTDMRFWLEQAEAELKTLERDSG
jgi:tetratricopeptide (TPR) repeat protein